MVQSRQNNWGSLAGTFNAGTAVDSQDRRFAYDPIGNRMTSLDDRSWVYNRNALKRCMVATGVPRQRRRPARPVMS